MSGFFRVQATVSMDSGITADNVVNVFHFDSDQTFAEDADDVAARVVAFYDEIDGPLFPFYVNQLDVKVYDMIDPVPRVPGVHIAGHALTPGIAAGLPNEIAMVGTLKAESPSGVEPKRRRGRVFIGPLGNTTIGPISGTNRVGFTDDAIQALADALDNLGIGPDAGDGRLSVFSPTTWQELGGTNLDPDGPGGGALAGAHNDVIQVCVDNAPDIIRSRGIRATFKTCNNVD